MKYIRAQAMELNPAQCQSRIASGVSPAVFSGFKRWKAPAESGKPDMCGRFTRSYTWEQIQALYRLTAPAGIPNLQPRFNACPTDPADTILEHDGNRQLVET